MIIKGRDKGNMDVLLKMFPSSPVLSHYLSKHDEGKDTDYLIKPKEWHHLCIGINGTSNTLYGVLVRTNTKVQFIKTKIRCHHFQDGDILKVKEFSIDEEKLARNKTFIKELKVNNCHLGSDSRTEVSDLCIWDKSLSIDEMISWSTCR